LGGCEAKLKAGEYREWVSASTVCWMVREVGQREEKQEAQFQANAARKVKAPIFFGEADGVRIILQKANDRKIEVRMEIAYTGKKYISKDRRKLLNKVCLTGVVSSQQWQERIRKLFTQPISQCRSQEKCPLLIMPDYSRLSSLMIFLYRPDHGHLKKIFFIHINNAHGKYSCNWASIHTSPHPVLRFVGPEFLSFRYFLNILSLGSCFQSTKMRNFGEQTV